MVEKQFQEGVGLAKTRPLPFYCGWRLRKCKCVCGEIFKSEAEYNSHYDTIHNLGGHNE